jgi:glycerophosphoryl diester phosphodiesterase
MTLEDAIELQLKLNQEHPQLDGRPFPTGLYIETKNVAFYKSRGIDIAGLVFKVLQKYEIETVEKSIAKGLPIILESFEEESLIDFRYKFKTDLPLIYLMHLPIYDMEHISTFAHGVGPSQALFLDK